MDKENYAKLVKGGSTLCNGKGCEIFPTQYEILQNFEQVICILQKKKILWFDGRWPGVNTL